MKLRQDRWWDLTAALLLLAVMTTAAYRLNDTNWTENLGIVVTLTFLGTLLGLGLGYSQFHRRLAGVFGLVYTLGLIPWQLTSLISSDVSAHERWVSIGGRLWVTLQTFLRNEPVSDPILFITSMALLFWLLALISGYQLVRNGKPWVPLIITAIAMVVFDLYHPPLAKRGAYTAIFTILALMYTAAVYFMRKYRVWKTDKITVESDAGFNLVRGALVAGLVLVVLAWNASSVVKAVTPNTTERHLLMNTLRSLRQRVENAVAPLQGSVPVFREYFDEEFSLGLGSQLSDDLVFRADPSITGRVGVAYYWRMRSYDYYANGRWESRVTGEKPIGALDDSVDYGNLQHRLSVRIRFTPERNLSMLYAPSLPLKVSRQATLLYEPAGEDALDVTSVLVSSMVRAGETYEVYSWVAAPTIMNLRASTGEYPEWVTERYLQLPPNFPPSIRALAQEITEGRETPYDKVEAVTSWLRNNIDYAEVIQPPEINRDPIEWMLFESKQGFCNYYATAEVLMLRSLGIPARWVVGYAQGTLNEDGDVYEVRERDSHAWPEVYFTGIGWVEFEPTAIQPVVARPVGEDRSPDSPFGPSPQNQLEAAPRDNTVEDDPFADRFESRSELPAEPVIPIYAIIGIALFLAGLALMILLIRIGLRDPNKSLPTMLEKTIQKRGGSVPRWLQMWSAYLHMTPIERAFINVEWVGHFLKARIHTGQTPSEQVSVLLQVFPLAEGPARTLLSEYEKAIYSAYEADEKAAILAGREIRTLAIKERFKTLIEWVLTGRVPEKVIGSRKPA